MSIFKHKRDVKLGIFIFIGLAFFIIGVLAIGNINKTFTRTIYISTIFDDVSGLQPGNNIWFSGVKIGTVKKINFYDSTSKVEVTMGIEEKSQPFIRKDARVKISTDGLIGNKIIIITGGSQSAPHVEAGDKLMLEKTLSTEDMLNTLQANNVNLLSITDDFKIISKQIASGEGTIGKLLYDQSLYDDIESSLASLKKASENAQQLTASVSAFTEKLNEPGSFANDIVTDTIIFNDVRNAVARLQTITADATQITNNLKIASSDINSNNNTPLGMLLHDEQTAATLKQTINNIDTASRKLNETLDALQHNFLLKGYFKKKEVKENN